MTIATRFIRWAPLVAVAVLGCKKKEAARIVYQSVPIERRDIIVSARATGTIHPDTVVEVKSKASGEILEMKAETGSMVSRGQLLVRVDQRGPRNTVNQAEANLDVAKARLQNADAQRRRSDELFKSQSITEQEHESAVLALANAKAEVVRAQVDVENARIAMEDTDVLAPIIDGHSVGICSHWIGRIHRIPSFYDKNVCHVLANSVPALAEAARAGSAATVS